jgi:hypothetical protein
VLAEISLYSISLWLHISAAVVGLGATFALAVGFPLAQKLDARYMPFIHYLSAAINSRLAGPSMVIILITGIYQVIDRWSFSEAWISASFVLIIALGALQGAYFTPTDRKLAALAEKELAAGATTLSEDYAKQAQREGSIGALAGLLVIVTIFLMVTKPG